MMGKEHFIETFGVPGLHGEHRADSGGAYTSLQVADALPGPFRRRADQLAPSRTRCRSR